MMRDSEPDQRVMLPPRLTKRLKNHTRLADVTETRPTALPRDAGKRIAQE